MVASKTVVETQYDFFNKYMIDVINTLPRFLPANRKGLAFDYPISFTPQFTVTAENKMEVLYDCEAQQQKSREAAFSRARLSKPKYTPIHPDCDDVTNPQKSWECTQNRMSEQISAAFELPRYIRNSGTIMVQFTIDEEGHISNTWRVVKSIGSGSGYALYKAIRTLPKMKPALDDSGNPVPFTIVFPLHVN